MDIIFTIDEISSAAAAFVEATTLHKVFLFQAEMGAGKTTFIKEVCNQMGVTENVSSPTFSIINEYHSGINEMIYHMDLYRLANEVEAERAGVEECIYSGCTCFIEWPEKAGRLMPKDAVSVKLTVLDNITRKLSILLPSD